MKIKSFMAMMVAAMAIVLGGSSCSSDDDDDVSSDLASQVVGSYNGDEIISIMNVNDTTTVNFEFAKVTDSSIDMTIPASGEGTMSFPALPVKAIPLSNIGSSITGTLATYSGKVTNASGAEKSYTVTELSAVFSGTTVVVTYTLQYGTMPMAMTTKFTGKKK